MSFFRSTRCCRFLRREEHRGRVHGIAEANVTRFDGGIDRRTRRRYIEVDWANPIRDNRPNLTTAWQYCVSADIFKTLLTRKKV